VVADRVAATIHRRCVVGCIYADAMARVAIVLHPDRPEAVAHGVELVGWLEGLGHDCVLPKSEAESVSLGGDGSMLRTVRLVADHDVPVLGVNFGKMGYLTEVEPAGCAEAITAFFAGGHEIEERMRLAVRIEDDDEVFNGLNEVVVEKVDSGRTLRVRVDLNGDFFTTYAADGIIVATPTGSTAYSLSARGPIVNPTHEALLLTPVAPHSLFDRSLVLSPDDVVRIEVLPDLVAGVAVDGLIVRRIEPGHAVVCSVADRPARLVSFGGRDFHRILKTKFGLADR
jgi:NAD+ kinase